MKLGMNWKEGVLALYIGLTLPLIYFMFFPTYICIIRANPVSELHEIQQLASKAALSGKKFTEMDVREVMKSADPPFEKIGYSAEILGSGEDWIIVVAKKTRRSRFDDIFSHPSNLAPEMYMLSAHDSRVIIVAGTGQTIMLDLATLNN